MSHPFHGPGFVYFLELLPEGSGIYKIGFSKNIEQRAKIFGDSHILDSFYSFDALGDENTILSKYYKHSHKAIVNSIIVSRQENKIKSDKGKRDQFCKFNCDTISPEWMYLKKKTVLSILKEFTHYKEIRDQTPKTKLK